MNPFKLSTEELRTAAAFCGGAALLAAVALVLSGSGFLSSQTTIVAATVLGDAQGVPPGYTGKTYPDDATCWIITDGKFPRGNYGAWVDCRRAGSSYFVPGYTFYSGIFSINPAGTPATGESVYINSTDVDAGFQQGPLLGPPFSTLGCPDGTTMVDVYGDGSTFDCYSGGGGKPVIWFGGDLGTDVGPATYCYSDTSGASPGMNDFGRKVSQGPSSYSFPSGYSLANGDKLDTTGGGQKGNDFSGGIRLGAGDGQCHAWKWTPQHVDSSLSTAGAAPAVAPGASLTLQWSCLPSRTVNVGSCSYHQFDSHCNSYSGTLYALNPLSSSVSGSGSGFAPSGLTGTQTITAPTTAGIYDYALTCAGGWNLPTMTIPVNVGGVAVAAPGVTISADKTSLTVGQSAVITATFTHDPSDTPVKTAINGPAPTPVPSGYSWTLAPGLSDTPPQSTMTYTFRPSSAGTYTFIPDTWTQLYRGWNHSGGQSVAIVVTATPPGTCPGAHQVNPPTCSCDIGYHANSAGTCVANTCGDPHAVPPLCTTCVSGYVMQGGVCKPVPPRLSISAAQTSVRKGNPASVSWSADNLSGSPAVQCAVSSSPAGVFSATMPAGTTPTWSGTSVATGAINSTTVFMLSCTGSTPVSVTVGLVPIFQEI